MSRWFSSPVETQASYVMGREGERGVVVRRLVWDQKNASVRLCHGPLSPNPREHTACGGWEGTTIRPFVHIISSACTSAPCTVMSQLTSLCVCPPDRIQQHSPAGHRGGQQWHQNNNNQNQPIGARSDYASVRLCHGPTPWGWGFSRPFVASFPAILILFSVARCTIINVFVP